MRVDDATQREAVGSWTGAEAVGSWTGAEAVGSWTGAETVGGWRAERQAAEEKLAWKNGGAVNTRTERRGDKIGSSEKSLKMSDSSSTVEFSLVTHASVSLYLLSGMHMHVVLHTFLCSWLTPSFVRVCSFVFLFSPVSLDRILVWWQEMCVAPSATSWSPAG